jgi:D-cysteine desulfhydrase
MLISDRMPARFPLTATPTPVQRVRRLEAAIGGAELYVKRDDLIGFGFAGNKARKLELLVADALDQGADVLVTGGGPTSNHVQATAAAARVADLDCVLLCYGAPPAVEQPSLAFARSFGADVRFTGDFRRESVDEGLPVLIDDLRAAGRRPYGIPRGGATALGAVAYVLAVDELAAQLDLLGVAPATVVVATGSGGTQAGIVAGTVRSDRGWRVVGASVSRPVAECGRRVLELARSAAELCGSPPATTADVMVHDARGPGYGRPAAEGDEAARLAANREGLLLDPVYTAKAMAHALRIAAEDRRSPVLFWHTGGVPLLSNPVGER